MSRRRGAGVGQEWGAGRHLDARLDDGVACAHAASPSGGQGRSREREVRQREPRTVAIEVREIPLPRCTSARGRRIVDPTLRPEEER